MVHAPDDTDALARRLSAGLRPGDTLLLDGPLGSGKTHFARAFIRAAFGADGSSIEVPSPSFTLVQTYAPPGGEIWHADLYRLSDPQETLELGLDEAFDTAVCLVEWPSRWGEAWPDTAALLRFHTPQNAPESRHLSVWGAPDAPVVARILAHLTDP